MRRATRLALWIAAAGVAVATLALYGQPALLVAVSDMVWACLQ